MTRKDNRGELERAGVQHGDGGQPDRPERKPGEGPRPMDSPPPLPPPPPPPPPDFDPVGP